MIPPDVVKLDLYFLKYVIVLLLGGSSSFFCCYSLITSYRRKLKTDDRSSTSTPLTKYFCIAAVTLALLRLIVTLVACCLCIIKDGRRDEVDEDVTTRPLKGHVRILIGLARAVALPVACLEFAHILTEKPSVEAYVRILSGSVFGSFCMIEFLQRLELFGVIHGAVEKDLGYFKFVIAASLCAVQKLYGSRMHMVSAVVICIILNLLNSFILHPPFYIQDHYPAATPQHHAIPQPQMPVPSDNIATPTTSLYGCEH